MHKLAKFEYIPPVIVETPIRASGHPSSGIDRTVAENCQMLCRECNRRKSGK
ncbi:MAG: HNH endonuclease [Bacteroidales bacterium]|nr:HNH endonuclease [Bacteroidales bacterium]